MEPEQQAAVLAADRVARYYLASNGQAEAVIDILNGMNQEQQAKVFAAPWAVWELANNGQAKAVIQLLNGMNQEQQAAVFVAPYAELGLAVNGQGAAVDRIKASWQQNSALPRPGRQRQSGGGSITYC